MESKLQEVKMIVRPSTWLVASVALPCGLLLAASTVASAHGPGSVAAVARPAAPAPNVEQVHRRRRGGHIGRDVGIGLGILGAAILLNEAARADGRRRYSRDSYCGRLLYRCESGSDWSCEKYEERCM
jgi:hypothetical protein